MRRHRLAMCIVVLVYTLLSTFFQRQNIWLPNLEQFSILTSFEDAETRLATSQMFSLAQADIYDLELIPRISDRLALRIMKEKERILEHAASLPYELRYKALEIVYGIGPKTALTLNNYLDLNPYLDQQEVFKIYKHSQ